MTSSPTGDTPSVSCAAPLHLIQSSAVSIRRQLIAVSGFCGQCRPGLLLLNKNRQDAVKKTSKSEKENETLILLINTMTDLTDCIFSAAIKNKGYIVFMGNTNYKQILTQFNNIPALDSMLISLSNNVKEWESVIL